MTFHSFLWLASILLYLYTTSFLFIHSSVDGNSGCLCVLAVVSDPAVNLQVRTYMCTFINEVWLTYSVVLASAVQHSDSVKFHTLN